jgi:hypothetical protein
MDPNARHPLGVVDPTSLQAIGDVHLVISLNTT